MRTGVSIGGAEALALKGALLVYEGRGTSFVAWHQVAPLKMVGHRF